MRKVSFIVLFFLIQYSFSATVLSWVPPYDVDACKANLTKSWGGYGPKDGISHLALQFWVPTGSGGIKLVPSYTANGVNATNIAVFRDWAKPYHIKTMLCIYNGESGWDWGLAVGAFKTYKTSTINALLAEVTKYNLDGVEIDLEASGGGISATDNAAFVAFLDALGDSLHAKGLELTVAAGANLNLGPDWDLWSSMAPHVDGITSMGYGFIGMNASVADHKFSAQKAHINDPTKLLLGIPGYSSLWEGNSLVDHLTWIKDDGVVGVGIWDFKFNQVGWQTVAPWKLLSEIRGALVKQFAVTSTAGVGGTISPKGEVSVDSASNQAFTITPDTWYIIDYVEVDNVNKGNISTHTFNNVTSTHTIKAYFKEDPSAPKLYSITASASSNGAISPSGTITAASGDDKSFTVTANSGYQVEKVLIDGIDRGPIVSADINNISYDHSIVASFKASSGGDLGKYEEWYSSIQTPNGDTIFWNDTLWMYQGSASPGGWGSSMEPSVSLDYNYDPGGYGTTPWLYVGLYNGVADTLITADMVYNSATTGKDTLIITTISKASGVPYNTKIDTIILTGTTVVNGNKVASKLSSIMNISSNGMLFNAVNTGSYRLNITDLRGRVLKSEILSINKIGTVKLNQYYRRLSNGLYLVSISKGINKVNSKLFIN